jgi:hypothetical protein
MPRTKKPKVEISFRKAGRSPSERKTALPQPTKEPGGLSPLAQYIEDNAGSKLTRAELVEQFQEYDCDHKNRLRTVSASTFDLYTCPNCGLIDRVEKS